MNEQVMTEILQSIAESNSVGSIAHDISVRTISTESGARLSQAINEDLGVVVTPEEIDSAGSLTHLATLVESRLLKSRSDKTLKNIYEELGRFAREEYHPKIPYHWCAKWNDFLKVGNWLTRPDGLDSVEIVFRMEQEYGIQISDQEAEALGTVGQTVRYLWAKTDR
jgi:acyl carrier protein